MLFLPLMRISVQIDVALGGLLYGSFDAKMTPEDALALVEDIRRKEAATA